LNSGFPVLRAPGIEEWVERGVLKTGNKVKVDIKSGQAENTTSGDSFNVEPMSPVQREIYEAGGLFSYAREIGGE
jgi:3-isopropylmalate/(R)-2-methylmalate dehydratase small subunit